MVWICFVMVFTLVCSKFTNDLLKSSANVENLANLAVRHLMLMTWCWCTLICCDMKIQRQQEVYILYTYIDFLYNRCAWIWLWVCIRIMLNIQQIDIYSCNLRLANLFCIFGTPIMEGLMDSSMSMRPCVCLSSGLYVAKQV